MGNLKLNSWSLGNSFHNVAEKAQEISKEKNQIVEFEFNGIICLANSVTNLQNLYRDYCNAWTMEWKKVGPDCVDKYSQEMKLELARRNQISEEKESKRVELQRQKEANEKMAFEETVLGIEMEFSDNELWLKGRANNTDGYGSCIYDYAEGWAKLMQVEISSGKTVTECADEASHKLGFYGITGFMYGAAVSVLSLCWIHGEDLRKWHNKEYNHEGEGVVNPAILTVKQ